MKWTNADQGIQMELLPDLSRVEERECFDDASSLDFLRGVYRDPCQPIQRRMRAAIAALPFECPKLAVIASVDAGSGFGAKLEAAIARSRTVVEGRVLLHSSRQESSVLSLIENDT